MAKSGSMEITIDSLGRVSCDNMGFNGSAYEVAYGSGHDLYAVTWVKLVPGSSSEPAAVSTGLPFHLGEIDGTPFEPGFTYMFIGAIYSTSVESWISITKWRTIKPAVYVQMTIPVLDNDDSTGGNVVTPLITRPKKWLVPALHQIFN